MNSEESVEFARKFVADIISFFGENITVSAEIEDDIINIEVEDSSINSLLIGRSSETLRSIQFLLGSALRSQNAVLSRVNLDIAGYKKQREDQMAEKARSWIEQVRETGDSYIANLDPADRRIVHRVAAEYEDVHTFSEGEGRDRRIVIAQKSS